MEPKLPIGELLAEAGLISQGQLQTALYDQQMYADMRLGEILVSRGWLKAETINFFVETLQHNHFQRLKDRLGDCFMRAALINGEQVANILKEQELNHVRFGSVAVLKGYISQKTLDFFLKYVIHQSQYSQKMYWQSTNGHLETDFAEIDPFQPIPEPVFVEQPIAAKKPQPSTTRDDLDIHWI